MKRQMMFTFIALISSFAATAAASVPMIQKLREMKFGQEVREDGPQTHLKKQGTPTMGGIVFIPAALLVTGISCSCYGFDRNVLLIMLLTAGFGLTGFLDDYIKIKKHHSEGLKPKQKLLIQLFFVAVFLLLSAGQEGFGEVLVPFTGLEKAGRIRIPALLFIPFVLLVALGTDNGVNFTDGLDGLCSSVTAVVAGMYTVIGLVQGTGLSVISAAICGSLMGFLLFNAYPAKVFMGDTGSLALGGYVAASAIVTGTELYIPVAGFIYMIEVLSVIIQVTYFRKTGGKRFFRMAPIHHHFEKTGNSETRIVTAFTVITAILCLLSLTGMMK